MKKTKQKTNSIKYKTFNDKKTSSIFSGSIEHCEQLCCDFLNKNDVEIISINTGGSNLVNWITLFYRDNGDSE